MGNWKYRFQGTGAWSRRASGWGQRRPLSLSAPRPGQVCLSRSPPCHCGRHSLCQAGPARWVPTPEGFTAAPGKPASAQEGAWDPGARTSANRPVEHRFCPFCLNPSACKDGACHMGARDTEGRVPGPEDAAREEGRQDRPATPALAGQEADPLRPHSSRASETPTVRYAGGETHTRLQTECENSELSRCFPPADMLK